VMTRGARALIRNIYWSEINIVIPSFFKIKSSLKTEGR
jgi:hypothetical protein